MKSTILKLSCDSRFQRAFTACSCVFKVITLIGSSQGNYFENATTCSKRMLKTRVTTQLKILKKCLSGVDAINISGLLNPKKFGNFNNQML
jgi:hypothetical protein